MVYKGRYTFEQIAWQVLRFDSGACDVCSTWSQRTRGRENLGRKTGKCGSLQCTSGAGVRYEMYTPGGEKPAVGRVRAHGSPIREGVEKVMVVPWFIKEGTHSNR